MNIKYCCDCKYYMFGTCLHKNAAYCNHSELWTPIDFEPFNMSILHLPDDIKDLIESGVYTEEEILKFIESHGCTNKLTENESWVDDV